MIFSGFIDSQLFDSHPRGIFLPLLDTKNLDSFHYKTFKECFNCILNCLGLPILLSVFISLLFHQVFTTTIMIQKCLILYSILLWYFIRPTSVIQTITARRFSHACYHQRCGETRWRRAFNCHAVIQNKSTISDETKNVSVRPWSNWTTIPILMLAALSANLVKSLLWSYQSTVTSSTRILSSQLF